jgi:hypothetical protein
MVRLIDDDHVEEPIGELKFGAAPTSDWPGLFIGPAIDAVRGRTCFYSSQPNPSKGTAG